MVSDPLCGLNALGDCPGITCEAFKATGGAVRPEPIYQDYRLSQLEQCKLVYCSFII
jgi:hypothetical protein